MEFQIVWSSRARKNLQNVINYLEKNWTKKEILQFQYNLKKLLHLISRYPGICPSTGEFQDVRKGLVDKHTYLIYRVRSDYGIIQIIYLRGTRQKPLK